MTQLFNKSPCRVELPEEREKIGERIQKWACEMEEVVISMRVCFCQDRTDEWGCLPSG